MGTIGILATGSIAGCLGNDAEAGQLTVRNDHVLDHVVRFGIEDGPSGAYEVEQGVAADLFVNAGETKTYTDLFPPPGSTRSSPNSLRTISTSRSPSIRLAVGKTVRR